MFRTAIDLPKIRGEWEAGSMGGKGVYCEDGSPAPEVPCLWNTTTGHCIAPPYSVGEKIYGLEIWQIWTYPDYSTGESHIVRGSLRSWLNTDDEEEARERRSRVQYQATVEGKNKGPWRQPSSMPWWASRFPREVTAIRAEQLKDISNEDVVCEGCERDPRGVNWGWKNYEDPQRGTGLPWTSFMSLWQAMHGPLAWNPETWVWVTTLKGVTI